MREYIKRLAEVRVVSRVSFSFLTIVVFVKSETHGKVEVIIQESNTCNNVQLKGSEIKGFRNYLNCSLRLTRGSGVDSEVTPIDRFLVFLFENVQESFHGSVYILLKMTHKLERYSLFCKDFRWSNLIRTIIHQAFIGH